MIGSEHCDDEGGSQREKSTVKVGVDDALLAERLAVPRDPGVRGRRQRPAMATLGRPAVQTARLDAGGRRGSGVLVARKIWWTAAQHQHDQQGDEDGAEGEHTSTEEVARTAPDEGERQ